MEGRLIGPGVFTDAGRACVWQVARLAPQHLARVLVVKPRSLDAPVPRLQLAVSVVSVALSICRPRLVD